MEKAVKNILDRTEKGFIVTPEDRETIEIYVAETLIQVGTGQVELIERIQTLFPDEYGKGIDKQK